MMSGWAMLQTVYIDAAVFIKFAEPNSYADLATWIPKGTGYEKHSMMKCLAEMFTLALPMNTWILQQGLNL